eukprot:TRINITY_DN9894_c0_g1_i1.p1 TRINITY_DN9894_c0_g1~~TRINITY_DN9894_c0_g1_i1.p1  ORF type:complete len:186 (+),score=43.22 TRINITY_DN9894_c0_g1_i1:224-781(+)
MHSARACLLATIVLASSAQPLRAPLERTPDTACTIRIAAAGTETMAIYFVGNQTLAMDGKQEPGYEKLVQVLQPGEAMEHTTMFHHSFVARSGSHQFRAKISAWANSAEQDSKTWPYKLMFRNIMSESPHKPIELKHSTNGYLWIEPEQEVWHKTDVRHEFVLRDKNKRPKLSVMLGHLAPPDEL